MKASVLALSLCAIFAVAPVSARSPSLLSMFPGSTARALSNLADHIRLKSWSFGIQEKKLAVDDLRLVIPASHDLKAVTSVEPSLTMGASDEAVLQVGHLSANWSSYDAAPTVDFKLADPTVLVVFDGLVRKPGASVRLGTTNWQRLRKSGFPPSFSSAHSSSKSSTSSSDSHQGRWPSTSDLLGDQSPPASPPVPKGKSKRALLGVLKPRLRKIECSGNCTVKFQATVWGQRIAAGFPDAIVVPGALVTQLWNKAVADFGGGDSLDIDEAAEALTHVVLMIVLDELAAASAGDQGPVVSAVRTAVQRLIIEALAKVDASLNELLGNLTEDVDTERSSDSSGSDI